MRVAIITLDQRRLIREQEFKKDSLFNPVRDADNNLVISEQEIIECDKPEFEWLKTLPLTDFKPKPYGSLG